MACLTRYQGSDTVSPMADLQDSYESTATLAPDSPAPISPALGPHRWKPGQSGNPAGRPAGLQSYIKSLTKDGNDVIRFYVQVFQGKHGARRSLKARMEAAQWLSDHLWGKPVQQIRAEGISQIEITVTGLDGEQSSAKVIEGQVTGPETFVVDLTQVDSFPSSG